MNVTSIHRHLQQLYAVPTAHAVVDYLVTDPAIVQALAPTATVGTRPPEQLLVYENGDQMELSLYIDAAVLERLRQDDPSSRLHNGNMSDLCLAVEGVSHFTYLVWHVTQDRSLTPLELELQAEVDKYVSMAQMMLRQHGRRVPKTLHKWLFDNAHFRTDLDAEVLKRYQDANEFAGRYCSHLERRYFRGHQRPGLDQELRRFYRLNRAEKLRRIRATGC